ncbi:F-box/LRR-repeat protein [Melia azedarach]|uniref:F-box/LRR-repeat protein n=2 Tax=Melia azedarach TaxID=155640 RepID=A0ACC1Y6A2_MELAZ|nr:F-box/LRR-repeat protein [Melia azedarach]KAJ4718050.1 F-box/LRR-repeat protein [Melia azedarach]
MDGVDRISELPPFIVHLIMSYLSPKEVAQTSVLSKSWNQLWSSFPILDLDESYFTGRPWNERTISYVNQGKRKKKFLRNQKKFINLVYAFLIRFYNSKLCIQKLRLYIHLLNVKKSSPLLDKWIELAIANGVRELDLEIVSDINTKYALPPIMFSAIFLTTLIISGCKLEQCSVSISFHSLRELTLKKLCISGKMLQKLTSECPVLEGLFIYDCRDLNYLCISKALKLKIVRVALAPGDFERVKIIAPILERFSFSYNGRTTPFVVDMVGCPRLHKLMLSGAILKEQEFQRFLSNFPLLEDLSLFSCEHVKDLTVSSTHLRNLELRGFACKAIDIDIPNLLSFSYSSLNHFVHTAVINAPCAWNVSVGAREVDMDTRWYLNLKQFLGELNQIEELSVNVLPSNKISFNLDEFRIMSTSFAPREVENLCLCVDTPPSNYPALLNGVLSVCFSKTVSVRIQSEQDRSSEWLYDELRNRDVVSCCCCCSCSEMKCWRHYLKDVKIQSFSALYDKKGLVTLDAWPILPCGILQLQLDWSFPEIIA